MLSKPGDQSWGSVSLQQCLATLVTAEALGNGGLEVLYGSATGTTISSGGRNYVASGGVESGTTLSAGGVKFVFTGGLASGNSIKGGLAAIYGSGVGGVVSSGSGHAPEVWLRAKRSTRNR